MAVRLGAGPRIHCPQAPTCMRKVRSLCLKGIATSLEMIKWPLSLCMAYMATRGLKKYSNSIQNPGLPTSMVVGAVPYMIGSNTIPIKMLSTAAGTLFTMTIGQNSDEESLSNLIYVVGAKVLMTGLIGMTGVSAGYLVNQSVDAVVRYLRNQARNI